jgi:hypothetical protein
MNDNEVDVLAGLETCAFVPLSKLVPQEMHGWFFDALSEHAPFSWGDNDRTMLVASRFLIRAREVVQARGDEGQEEFVEKLFRDTETLERGNIYIDLEN